MPFSIPINEYRVDKFCSEMFEDIGFFNRKEFDDNQETIMNIIEYTMGNNPRRLIRLTNYLSLANLLHENLNVSQKILLLSLSSMQMCYNEIYNQFKIKGADFTQWGQEEKTIWKVYIENLCSNSKDHYIKNSKEKIIGLLEEVVQSIIALSDESNFDEMNLKLCYSLKKYWDKYLSPLSIYKARKMINLLLKEITLLQDLSHEERQKLINLLHIPIDSSTLEAIRIIFNGGEFQHNIGHIPINAKMGFIDSDDKYIAIQEFFKFVAKKASVPSIYFDVLLWNKSRDSESTIAQLHKDKLTKKESDKVTNSDKSGIYTYNEFLESSTFNSYTTIVKGLVSELLEKISLLKVDFKIKRRKGAIAITPALRTKDNIITVWVGKTQINIEFYGQEKKPYYSTQEINDILIEKIQKKFLEV